MSHLVNLEYCIDETGNNEFYVYLNKVTGCDLPNEATAELSGFGISTTTSVSDTQSLLISRFRFILEHFWQPDYGIPYFTWTGTGTRILDPDWRNTSVLIFFLMAHEPAASVLNQLRIWKEQLANFVQFTFIAVDNERKYCFFSRDRFMVADWLDQQMVKTTQEKEKVLQLNIETLHKAWYPDETFRKSLLSAAKDVLDEFIVRKGLNIYIPEYIVTPVYHIRRVQKANTIFMQKYQPKFIMTLPLHMPSADYTVLFPITKTVTRRNLHVGGK